MKLLYVFALAMALLGTRSWAQDPAPESSRAIDETRESVEGEEQLVETRSKFEESWVNPDADFSRYDKLYGWGAVFEFRDVGSPQRSRSRALTSGETEFGIDAADRAKFQETVSEAFRDELERSKLYTVVDEIGPDTLIIRGAVLDIVSRVPPPMSGRSQIYLASVGEATLVVDLIDAETGVIMARVSERREIQPPGGGRIDQFSMPTNSVTVWSDVRRWARSSAAKLRKELEKAKKRAQKTG